MILYICKVPLTKDNDKAAAEEGSGGERARGCGTTGVAGERRGRRFVGVEIDPGGFAEGEQGLGR